jgi:hypothetical protein
MLLAPSLNRIGMGETSSTILANSARLMTHMCSVSVARFDPLCLTSREQEKSLGSRAVDQTT